jgi:hypothetical protein
MIYAWHITVQRLESDAFVYTHLGKVPYTKIEFNHMGFKVYNLDDYYTFIARHDKQSMITIAAIRLGYISYTLLCE